MADAAGTQTAEEQAAAAAAAAADDGGSASSKGNGEKMLPQSEVDRIVQDRLARAAKGQPSKDELTELRAAKVKLEEIEQAGASELEKANTAREKAEAKAAEATSRAEQALIRATALAELSKQGVSNVEGALRALDKTGLTVGDDGTVSGAEEAVKNLLETIPEFVGKVVHQKVDQGARGGGSGDPEQVTEAQLDTMSAEEITKATREGRMADLLG